LDIAHRARADNLADLPVDDFPRLRFTGLVADCDSVARLDQPSDVPFRGMKRNPAHRHPVPLRQCDVQDRSRRFRIIKEQFVKISKSEQQEGSLGQTPPDALILLHHRSGGHVAG
jgi:hypothetical protein